MPRQLLLLTLAFAQLFLHSHCALPKHAINAHISESTSFSEVKIAFGSLYSVEDAYEQDILDQIVEARPDVFLWLGDPTTDHKFVGSSILDLKQSSSYLKLKKHGTHISGVADIEAADESNKNAFFYFLDEDLKSYRRTRKGIYDAFWIVTNPGNPAHEKKLVKVILLNIVKFGEEEDEISKEQWQWLSDELQEKQQDHITTIIASPYQILPSDKIYDEALETSSKKKLIKMIASSPVPVILASGTFLHSFGEVIKYPCSESDFGYTLYEISSAGLNSNAFLELKFLNKLTIPNKFNNFTDRTFKPNFGQIRIKYNHIRPDTSELFLEIIDEDGKMLISRNPRLPTKPIVPIDSSYTSVCTKKLYDGKRVYRDMLKHTISMLLDREFRVITLAAVALLLILFSGLCYIGSMLFKRGAGAGAGNGAEFGSGFSGGFGSYGSGFGGMSEYEKYHMDLPCRSRSNSKRHRRLTLPHGSDRPQSPGCKIAKIAGGFGSDNQSDASRLTMDQTLNANEGSETMKLLLENERSVSDLPTAQAFKSTLVTLSEALATMDEGECLRWDTNCSQQKGSASNLFHNTKISTLVNVQSPSNNSPLAMKKSLDLGSLLSSLNRNCHQEMNEDMSEAARMTEPRRTQKSFTEMSRSDSKWLGNSPTRSIKRMGSGFRPYRKSSTAFYVDNAAQKDEQTLGKTRLEREGSFGSRRTTIKPMYQDDHFKLSKLNLGEQGFISRTSVEPKGSEVREILRKTLSSRTKWGNAVQWTPGMTLANIQIKRKKSGASMAKSLNKSGVFSGTERIPIRSRTNTSEGYASYEEPVMTNYSSQNPLDAYNVVTKAHQLQPDEVANQDFSDFFDQNSDLKASTNAQTQKGLLQSLIPSLKIKRDIIPRVRAGTPLRRESNAEKQIQAEPKETFTRYQSKLFSIAKSNQKLSSAKVNNEEMVKANIIIENRLRILEEKYAGYSSEIGYDKKGSHAKGVILSRRSKVAAQELRGKSRTGSLERSNIN